MILQNLLSEYVGNVSLADTDVLCYGEYKMTYGQLAENSGRIANKLSELAGPHTAIAVMSSRRSDYIVSALGILYARQVFCPIDNAACIFQEILTIYNEYKIRCFNFIDSSIEDYGLKGKEVLNELCELIIRNPIHLSFRCNIRADSFKDNVQDKALIKKMIQAGFHNIFIGIESNAPNDLHVFNKRATVEDNHFIIKLLKSCGITPKYGFIMINPYSTVKSLENNFNFLIDNKNINLNNYINIMEVYYGSDMYHMVKKDGLLWDDYHYIRNLAAYNFIDPYMIEIVDFIKKHFMDQRLMGAYNDYIKFDYFLSYTTPLFPNELKSFKDVRQKKNDELLHDIAEFMGILFLDRSIPKAEKYWPEFKALLINQYHQYTLYVLSIYPLYGIINKTQTTITTLQLLKNPALREKIPKLLQ